MVDIGGGASPLVDSLLDRGHRDITVLDLSQVALDTALSCADRGAHVGLAMRGPEPRARAQLVDEVLLVGGQGIALDEFLTQPAAHWLQD